MTPSAKTATGIGTGVTLAWIWNAVLPAAMGLWTSVEGWPMMPAEVAAAVGPVAMALLDQFVSDT
jgi:hypothetical protein